MLATILCLDGLRKSENVIEIDAIDLAGIQINDGIQVSDTKLMPQLESKVNVAIFQILEVPIIIGQIMIATYLKR